MSWNWNVPQREQGTSLVWCSFRRCSRGDHDEGGHRVMVGVLLAPDGGEKYVQLPYAEDFAANRQHPLHVKVHLGQPGEVGQVYVAYGADGVLTPEAQAFCGGTFVNG
jgi:hypothetical protein